MTALLRAWQMAIHEAAVQSGYGFAFRLNTYIISVLVIFYLQLNHNFPKLEDLPQGLNEQSDYLSQVNAKELKQALRQFFTFYGKVYEKCKLISCNIGRWQNRRLDKHQQILSPERKKFVSILASDVIFEIILFLFTFN